MFDYAAYAQSLREEIHMYPEIGFDLPKTLAVVHRELDKMGIAHTDKWGRSSVVGYINEEKQGVTIGLRADMDALPIQEANNVPYKSRHDGIMHACGHDIHTAILLATAKYLVDHKDEIHCRVKLLFTPAEEYETPGCKELAENGVMDDVDFAVCLHVDTGIQVGCIGAMPGGIGANSTGFKAKFYGKTSHAASQQRGKDAIIMAVEAISAIEMMVAKEISAIKPRILNIGSIHGGNTNNIICDYVEIFGTHRTHEDAVSEYMNQRIKEIVEGTAAVAGGRGEFEVVKFLPHTINNEILVAKVRESAAKIVGEENIIRRNRTLGGEDFGFLSRQKPCMQMKLGVKPKDVEGAIPPVHNERFEADNGCFEVGIRVFVQFIKDHMNGIDFS